MMTRETKAGLIVTASFLGLLGAVFLAVTGGEALYTDLGHFGKSPIRSSWLFLVLPALLINYFGQGALLLQDPANLENPFYLLAPEMWRYALVLLATVATVPVAISPTATIAITVAISPTTTIAVVSIISITVVTVISVC